MRLRSVQACLGTRAALRQHGVAGSARSESVEPRLPARDPSQRSAL